MEVMEQTGEIQLTDLDDIECREGGVLCLAFAESPEASKVSMIFSSCSWLL